MRGYNKLLRNNKINFKIVLFILISVILIFYIADLMFGERSFFRMIELDKDLQILDKKVKILKEKNAKLQKEYFELKELE